MNQPTDVSNCLHNNYPHCMYVLILVDKSCTWANCPSNQDKAYRATCGVVVCAEVKHFASSIDVPSDLIS